MTCLLNDDNTYIEINRDQTLKVERMNNDMVKNLHNNGYIDTRTKFDLLSHHSHCPRIYGLPKVHKPELPSDQ